MKADANALSLSHLSKATDGMHFDEKIILLLASAQMGGTMLFDIGFESRPKDFAINLLDRELDASFDLRA